MRILYIQQHFATAQGEAGVRGYRLVRTLVERGHEVTVVCGHNWRDSTLPAPRGRWRVEQDLDGFRLVQLAVFYSNHQGCLARIAAFLLFGLLASWEALRRPADLVFASSTPLTVSLPALVARWVRGIPYVLEVRDLWPDLPIAMGIIRNPLAKRALRLWERTAYRWAWRLVALAPGIKQGIERNGQVAPDRIAMIPNGSDIEGLRPLGRPPRKDLGVADDVLALGYAGTHGIANGLDAVLDAAAVLRRRGVRDVAFVFIGDGREKARLVRRAEKEGLDNVRFLGLVSKAHYNQVLAELDVGMQILLDVPAFYYGTSPNKFFDYLAVGKPVLVNYPGWMSDLVKENGCGVAVPPRDPEAFADAVERLNAERDRLQEQGRAARALAESRFSHAEILPQLARFVEELPGLARAPQRAPALPPSGKA